MAPRTQPDATETKDDLKKIYHVVKQFLMLRKEELEKTERYNPKDYNFHRKILQKFEKKT